MKKLFLSAIIFFYSISCVFAQDKVSPSAVANTFLQNFESWWNGTYFFGDWAGKRQKLADQGVDIVSTYVADLLTNSVGGLREHRFRYDSSLGLDVNVNLEKTSNLTGLQFHISGLYRQGKNLAGDIGNRFPPSSIYGSEQVRLYNIYLEQAMFNGKASLKAGRLGTGDDFAQSPLYWTFLTNSIDGCPINLPINFFFTVYPTATWGARLKVNPVSAWAWKGGIYHEDSRIGRNEAHGADFTWRKNKGLLFIQEFSFLPNQYQDAKGLPGNYKLGLFYTTGRFNDLYQDENGNSYALTSQPQKRRYGNYGFYFHADQMLYREPNTIDQGFLPFFVVVAQPANVNEIPFFLDLGLTYKGLIPGRDNDVAGVAFAYGKWSRQLNKYQNDSGQLPQKYEMVIETTYKIAVNQWLYFQPDIQYIINPKGGNNNDADDALVTGARVGITF
ncbi:MAG: carbohydrate porin [Candidatus Omnitrophica bacterium]|nr:carbohydrate porin [Candidatus Omnitrophota bacterium]MDD5652926.1 carbohydrate porin [Candidatus Omnitrophota bacterium]